MKAEMEKIGSVVRNGFAVVTWLIVCACTIVVPLLGGHFAGFGAGVLMWLGWFGFVVWWTWVKGIFDLIPGWGSDSNTLRGTEIYSTAQALKYIKKNNLEDACSARIGEIPIPESVETTHFLMAGATGSGKSLAFIQLLDSARDRGHRAVVADLGGEFVKRYYREGKDLILCPFDARTKAWSPFAEMRQSFDAARIAASMIPEGSGESREWNGYARAVLEGILERCFENDIATNESLVYYCLGADTSELRELCQGTPAAVYFVQGNERQLGSIRGILASYIKPLTYLRPEAGKGRGFSIRNWVEAGGDTWLFLPFKKDQLDAIRSMLAAQIDTVATSILSTDSQLDRRLWIALDEFSQIGEIKQLEPLLALGRKFGVCAVLGMQAPAQPAMVFGRERAQSILASLGTWTVFRQGDADSAEYMSKFLGDEEIRRMVSGTSQGEDSRSQSESEQIVRQRAIMPGELQQLRARVAVVNVAGPMPPAVTEIPLPTDRPGQEKVLALDESVPARAMTVRAPAGLLTKAPPTAALTPKIGQQTPPPQLEIRL